MRGDDVAPRAVRLAVAAGLTAIYALVLALLLG